MSLKKAAVAVVLVACLAGGTFAYRYYKTEEADFSKINTICELATMKYYYHNVAQKETEASGRFKWLLNTGYKKIWVEYSGIAELGIDVNKIEISKPNRKGVIEIKMPEAEILNKDFDIESVGEPLTDAGFFTKITKEEETEIFAKAQENMMNAVESDNTLFEQARERAKELIEDYIKNVGKEMGKEYTVKWVD